jgi:hypothetical protein
LKFKKPNQVERIDISARVNSDKNKYDHSVCFKNSRVPPGPCLIKDDKGTTCGLLHWRNEHGTIRPDYGNSNKTKTNIKSTTHDKPCVEDLIKQFSRLSAEDLSKFMAKIETVQNL